MYFPRQCSRRCYCCLQEAENEIVHDYYGLRDIIMIEISYYVTSNEITSVNNLPLQVKTSNPLIFGAEGVH